ncbi:XRE family transcriptional regulator [Corynebacterium hylobatis]|uniref:XRE family transcriptional regulator n=1 Tax=Corynebacterium hylobatis TaxID=1859290 RepID=A0A3R9ZCS9_9CORY|nr:helix-turn-helix transcriptional regulator [Corynebacterium hylobatis]RSZ61319.1 XRE family transcriptional regulator [Corynebacterium hylobatis]
MDTDERLLRAFGQRLRAVRTASGLSQEALAHAAGLHRTYVSSVERGERNIALLNILTLATVLQIDAGELVADLRRAPNPE